MKKDSSGSMGARRRVDRREFLKQAGLTGVGATALVAGTGRGRAFAATPSPYPDWIPASTKPPKRGGVLPRASAWDPPVIDPRHTQSIGLFQFAGLTSSRLIRYAFPDEANSTNDISLKGDLAESWQSDAANRVWTFKLRQGVKWQNLPPLNGRELVATDVKYCYEQYAKEGVQAFTFQEIEGMETPDKYTLRVHLKTPNALFPQNVAESVTVIFSREVLEEDGDLKKRLIGTGPYILKEHTRKVRVVLQRNPDYYDKGRPYIDEYVILSTPDFATRKAAFRTGQSDFLQAASLSEVEGVRKTNPSAIVQEYKNVLAPFGLALAQDKPPFNDLRVRRAISMAIDRQKQVDTVYEGHGIPGWGVPYIYYQDTAPTLKDLGQWWQYRPEAAKKLMAEAGHAKGFETTLFYYEYFPEMTSQVQLVQSDLLRPLRRQQVGGHVLGIPVGSRGRTGRADVHVHALQVHEELLPRQRSGHRRADCEAPADSRSCRAASPHKEDCRSGARSGVAAVDALRRRLLHPPTASEEHGLARRPAHRRLRVANLRPGVDG